MKRILGIAMVFGLVGALTLFAHEVKPGKVELIDLGKGVKLEMVLVPAGKFMMGEILDLGKVKLIPREATITKPFFMGKYEVTQEQWEAVMGNDPRRNKGENIPMTNISWNDCQGFIKKLNKQTKGGYRMPSEAEWEYGCRAGSSKTFSTGDELKKKDANHGEGDAGKPIAVGSYKPNAFGLYDMHGNVWEWCNDWYAELTDKPLIDPSGPATGSEKCLRGGCFYDGAKGVRSAFRYEFSPSEGTIYFGFRLARTE